MNQQERPPAALASAFPGKNAVPVVFSSSSSFVPVCGAVLYSLAKAADPERLYDLVILHREMDEERQSVLRRTVQAFPNVSVRFYDTSEITSRYQLRPIEHIPIETYYRFLIPEIMADYDKVLYLDCDLICQKDVAQLYDLDLGDHWIGAVLDVHMQGQAHRDRGMKFYLRDRLKIKDPSRYFQAGVLLLNTAALKKVHTTHEWLTFASEEYRYGDQDILNRYCLGHVLFLDMAWNLLADCDGFRVPVLVEEGPPENRAAYHEARKDPCIIHYAGREKPWNSETCDLAKPFWEIARETEFYEALREMLANSAPPKDRTMGKERPVVRFFKRICPHFLFSFARGIKRRLRL